MSRPAAAVRSVIKAYDVRGLVGKEIDEDFVTDVAAAFARLIRAEGGERVAIGYDMRESSPALAKAFAEGDRAGPRCRAHRAGVHRSAVFRFGISELRRCDVHRQPQSRRL